MSNPYAPPSTPQETDRRDESVPPPQLVHVLIWVVLSTVLIVTFQVGLGGSSRGGQLTSRLAEWGFAISSAASLTGIYVLRSTRRSPVFRQPGHWMLLMSAGAAISLVVFLGLSRVSSSPVRFLASIMSIVPLLLHGYAAWSNRGIWRLLFALGSAIYLIDMLHLVTFPGPNPAVRYSFATVAQPLLSLVMVSLASTRPRDHDWLHWLGVLVYISGLISSIVGVLSL